MKVLIIDECFFTRNGIKHYFSKKNVRHEIIDISSIQEANNYINHSMPDIIFIDLTRYCREIAHCPHLQFFSFQQEVADFIFILMQIIQTKKDLSR